MITLEQLRSVRTVGKPFPHFVVSDLLHEDILPSLTSDFPDPGAAGFFPEETLTCGPAFNALMSDLRSPAFSDAVGSGLGLRLIGLPQMIVVRRWSASRDGRPHTDGPDKVATALLYLNPAWENEAGSLRYLAGPDLDGPGTSPIPPRYGVLTAFARSDTSWHGHKPFVGERRVVQVFWLKDEHAFARKTKRHRRVGWLKAIWSRRPPV